MRPQSYVFCYVLNLVPGNTPSGNLKRFHICFHRSLNSGLDHSNGKHSNSWQRSCHYYKLRCCLLVHPCLPYFILLLALRHPSKAHNSKARNWKIPQLICIFSEKLSTRWAPLHCHFSLRYIACMRPLCRLEFYWQLLLYPFHEATVGDLDKWWNQSNFKIWMPISWLESNIKWGWPGSNRWPPGYEPGALPS